MTIEPLENEKNKKYSDIQLINVSSNVKEYNEGFNFIEFSFDKEIYIKNLKNLIFSDKNNKIHITRLENCKEIDNKIECHIDLFVRSGTYKIINLLYGNELIKTKGNLFFNVKEDILELKSAYNYISGFGIQNDKFNIIHFQFENIAYPKYFSSFLFKNEKTNKIYKVDYKFLFNNGGSVSEQCIFDFTKLPPGDYYISYIYKRKIQNTNKKIRIEQFKKINECDLYPD